jgi:hypothetical protein
MLFSKSDLLYRLCRGGRKSASSRMKLSIAYSVALLQPKDEISRIKTAHACDEHGAKAGGVKLAVGHPRSWVSDPSAPGEAGLAGNTTRREAFYRLGVRP